MRNAEVEVPRFIPPRRTALPP